MIKLPSNINKTALIQFQESNNSNQMIIIKFGASWCRPCEQIKPLCLKYANNLPSNITYIDIDIDKYTELYTNLRSKKMVKGIPVLLSYYNEIREEGLWYIPNDSVVGSDQNAVEEFFKRSLSWANLHNK